MTRRKKYDNINKIFENRNCEISACKFPASRIIKVDGHIVYICGTHFNLISDTDYINRVEDEPTNNVPQEQDNNDPHNDNGNGDLIFNEVKGDNTNGFKG